MIPVQAFMKQLQSGQISALPMLLLYGEEPLAIRKSLDAYRLHLKKNEYLQRDRYDVDGSFDWQSLEMDTQAGCLFSDRRIIELDIPKGTFGKQGGAFIQRWLSGQAAQSSRFPDICFVILAEKLDSKQTKAKWFQAIEAHGLVVQSRPVELRALPSWCQQRAQESQLTMGVDAANVLAERVEGNLLAADQEIEKLALIFAPGHHLQSSDIINNVADQAHYQLFALSTAALTGKTVYALQILNRLRQEGLEAPIILWLLAKETRLMIELFEKQRSAPIGQVFKRLRIWNSKQADYNQALRRHDLPYWQACLVDCANVDFEIKGIQSGDEWLSLNQLVVKMAS